jgi:predicted alpha/beta hydrolase family esterase
MSTTLIVPGIYSSGPDHWQTWFEERIPGSVRVIQRDWKDANLAEWSSRVRREIVRNPGQILIVAHSFGVLAAVQAAHDHSERIAGALLVAPADPEKFGVEDYLPATPLAFRAVVVGSTNDSWMRLERTAHWADLWGADLVNLGAAGHVNVDSGFGPWPEGLAIFERLRRAHAADSERDDSRTHDPASLGTAALRSLPNVRATRVRGTESTSRRALLRGLG